MLMSMRKIFLLKVIGLYGVIVSITSLITELLFVINRLKLSQDDKISLGLIMDFIDDQFGFNFLIVNIVIVIGALTVFLIGVTRKSSVKGPSSKKKGSLEHQVVGVILLFNAFMTIPTVAKSIGFYFQYKNNDYYPRVFVSLYERQIYISLVPIVIYSVIGILLLIINYRKRVIYSIAKDE